MFYKNISSATKTFYGVTFNPGEIKEVPGYINDKSFRCCAAPKSKNTAASSKRSAKPSAEAVKPTSAQPKPAKVEAKSESKAAVKPVTVAEEDSKLKTEKKEEPVNG